MSKLNSSKLLWMAANRYKNRNKIKKAKDKKRAKKRAHKEWMIQQFGKTRYYLSWWFGNWILFTWNRPKNPQHQEKKPIDRRVIKIQALLNDPNVNRFEKEAARAALKRISKQPG